MTGKNKNNLIVQKIIMLEAVYERLNVRVKSVHTCKEFLNMFIFFSFFKIKGIVESISMSGLLLQK